jgi:hypothetical protein
MARVSVPPSGYLVGSAIADVDGVVAAGLDCDCSWPTRSNGGKIALMPNADAD